MIIEIEDTMTEARLNRLLETTGSRTVEEVLHHLLDTQEEQDRWFVDNKDDINRQIRTGLAQLERGEGIGENEIEDYLRNLKIAGA